MSGLLSIGLHRILLDEYPDVWVRIDEAGIAERFLLDKMAPVDALFRQLLAAKQPAESIASRCVAEFRKQLGPSKFLYVSSVFAREFEAVYAALFIVGTLRYEVVGLVEKCAPLFSFFDCQPEVQPNTELYSGIKGIIQAYLDSNMPAIAAML